MFTPFRTHHNAPISDLIFSRFFFSLAVASIATVWGIYAKSFLNSDSYVGFFSAATNIFAIFCFFYFIPIFQQYSARNVYFTTIIFYAFLTLMFAINKDIYIFMILAFALTVMNVFQLETFGILVRHKTNIAEIAKSEGFVFTVLNLAFLIGPILAGFIAEKHSLNSVFIMSFMFIVISIFAFKMFLVTPKEKEKNNKEGHTLFMNFSNFIKQKELVLVYLLRMGITGCWGMIYLFIPLYMIKQGYSMSNIGYFLFAVCLPLILFEYTFGKKTTSSKYKIMFALGFFILALSVLSCFVISLVSGNPALILIILALASIGAAMIEPNLESYFFKSIKTHEEHRLYGPYLTSSDLGNILVKAIGAFLLFISYEILFLGMGLLMLFFVLISLKVKR